MKITVENVLNLKNKKNKISLRPDSYNYLFYGLPGSGKTSIAAEMFPNHVMIQGEIGSKGLIGVNGVPVADYKDLYDICNVLSKNEVRDAYDTIIVDTATKVGKIIENFITNKHGKEVMKDVYTRGGAYPLIDKYWDECFNRVKAKGYNFVWLCHTNTIDVKDPKNDDKVLYQKFSPKLSNRISNLIEPEVDYTFYFTHSGEDLKVVTCRTKKNEGKNRTNIVRKMPTVLDLSENPKVSARTILDELTLSIRAYGDENITEEKVTTNLEESIRESIDIEILKEEVKRLAGELKENGKGEEAKNLMERAFGVDEDGKQRKLSELTQMAETTILKLIDDLKEIL
ncbi:MAG: AAA family ATPase [Peptostreptococcaceae bacterium]|nr:AAA family ATPase [Peptostreptococcaceae bacterium]